MVMAAAGLESSIWTIYSLRNEKIYFEVDTQNVQNRFQKQLG